MKIDHVELLMVAIVLAVIGIAIGIISLASVIARAYGVTAGLLCIMLPIAAATAALIYLLYKENKGEKR